MLPSVLSPHVCDVPALTWVNVPAGCLAVVVPAPAGDGAVGSDPAAVPTARAHLREGSRSGRGLVKAIVSPAGDGAVGVEHPASVVVARAHLGERVCGRRRLATGRSVATRAGDAPVGLEPAGVLTPGAHLGESARGRGRLPVSVAAPA